MTVMQGMRQPVLLIITVTGCIMILLLPVLIAHQFGEDGKLVRDSALALYFVFGLPFCVFAADALRRERADGTAAVTLSKAVHTEVFFLAKYTGISLLAIGYAAIMTGAVLLADRIAPRAYLPDLRIYFVFSAFVLTALAAAGIWNFFTRRSFCAAAWTGWFLAVLLTVITATRIEGTAYTGFTFLRPLQWRIVPAGVLIGVALLVFTSIAAASSARLKPAPSVTLCFTVLLGGLLSDYALGRFADFSRAAFLAYRLAPNWQHFWSADWLTGGGTVPAGFMLDALIYAVFYITGILALGIVIWRHCEIR